MNVLIVEDALTTAMMLEAFVSACGHHAVCAPNAMLACSAAAEYAIDLVLMDMVLPGLDGYELAVRLREQGVRAPIVATTSLDDDPAMRLKYGIDGYMAKPVSMKQFKALLEDRVEELARAAAPAATE